jgi:hypothetical protein
MQRLSSLLVAVGLASACSTPHMVVPAEISKASEEVAVTERSSFSGALADESFKLGSYEIADVDRKWDSTSNSAGQLGFKSESTSGGYAYKFKAGGEQRTGGCMTEGGGKSMDLGGGMSIGKSFARLGCTCSTDADPVRVVLSSSTTEKYSGQVITRSGTYKVVAIYEAEGSLSSGQPSGYRVDGDSPRGAVEVLKPGRAWFARGMDDTERSDLACLYAGLLLYMPPSDN